MKVTCKACGKRYHYEKDGCCPECGAFNRPPQREKVDADGTVRHISEEEFWENGSDAHLKVGGKVCFEEKPHAHVEDGDVSYARETAADSWSDDTPGGEASAEPYHYTASSDIHGETGSPSYAQRAAAGGRGRRKNHLLTTVLLIFAAVIVLVIIGNILIFRTIHNAMDEVGSFWDNSIQISPQREEAPVEPADPEELGLDEVAPIFEDLVDVAYETQIGDSFYWKGSTTTVEDCDVEYLTDNGAMVTLQVDQGSVRTKPDISYINQITETRSYGYSSEMHGIGDRFTYTFHLPDAAEGTEIRAVFTGFIGDQYVEIQVPLT